MLARHRLLLCLGLLISLIGLCPAARYREGDVEVKFKPNSYFGKYLVPARLGARITRNNAAIGWYSLKLPPRLTTADALKRLGKMSEVLAAEPNFYRRPFFTPNDPDYPQQYGPQKINCPTAWNNTLGLNRVTIAFIDTGIDTAHPEFAGRIEVLSGCNIVDGNSDPTDNDGHGTHCAGIAAADTNNATGIAGICQATIMPVKVFDGNNGGTIDQVSAAYQFAANNGANIISASLGGTDPSQQELDAVIYAQGKGCLFVAAAGNNGSTVLEYPAAYPGVISVGASDANDAQTSYTEYGDWVTCAAPGDNILSTWIGETYQYDSGTSMATPHVSGALALLESFAPAGTDSSAIRDALLSTTDYIGGWTHYGRINVNSAMTLLSQVETGLVSIFPAAATAYEGTITSGSVQSLTAVDNATLEISSVSPTADVESASAQLEYLVSTVPSKITAARFNFAAYGTNNGVHFLYMYNWLKNRYDYIGQATMTATDDSLHSINLPTTMAPYVHNGQMLVVLRGWLNGQNNGGTAPPFTYQIDFSSVTLTVANGP